MHRTFIRGNLEDSWREKYKIRKQNNFWQPCDKTCYTYAYVKCSITFSLRVCAYGCLAFRRRRIHGVHSSKSFWYKGCSKKAACIFPVIFPAVTRKLLSKVENISWHFYVCLDGCVFIREWSCCADYSRPLIRLTFTTLLMLSLKLLLRLSLLSTGP